MKIYIDNDYCCHVENDGTMREFDVAFFDGKCKPYVEGFRYIPDGESWVRDDGVEFNGAMTSPFIDFNTLLMAQYEAELAQMADMQNALEILGVTE